MKERAISTKLAARHSRPDISPSPAIRLRALRFGGLIPIVARVASEGGSRGQKNGHIFNKRLALPLRILALSSSDSGTVCIHSSAGGFMTNGQSTANRI